MNKFWMIFVEGSAQGPLMQHETFEGAKLEAERLSKNKTQNKVYVLETIGMFSPPEPLKSVWEQIYLEE